MHEGERGTTAGVCFLRERLAVIRVWFRPHLCTPAVESKIICSSFPPNRCSRMRRGGARLSVTCWDRTFVVVCGLIGLTLAV